MLPLPYSPPGLIYIGNKNIRYKSKPKSYCKTNRESNYEFWVTKETSAGKKLSTKVKICIYETCVPSSLLYCTETWTTYARNINRINSFHMRCLRKLLKIKWQDKIPDADVLKRSGLTHLRTMIMQKRLKWLGHVKRMDGSRIPKTILFREARGGSRKQGRP